MNKDLKRGEVIENVQIAPFGDYENYTVDGRKVVQKCDKEAFQNIVKNFDKELIVDFEHQSETTDDSSAAGWILNVKVDDERGLVGDIRVSEKGATALNGYTYRFGSPAFVLDEDERPNKLLSFALTNRPAMKDIEKVYNTIQEKNVSMSMEKIFNALGLPADATEDMALEAIHKMVLDTEARKKEEEDKRLEDEAEKFVADLPEEVRNSVKDAYKQNAELTQTVINSVKGQFAKPEETVLNKEEAQKPSLADKFWETYNSLPQNQKTEYARQHQDELKQ